VQKDALQSNKRQKLDRKMKEKKGSGPVGDSKIDVEEGEEAVHIQPTGETGPSSSNSEISTLQVNDYIQQISHTKSAIIPDSEAESEIASYSGEGEATCFTSNRIQEIRANISALFPLAENSNADAEKLSRQNQSLLLKLLSHVENLTNKLHAREKCCICSDLPCVPYTIQECGHTFCFKCLQTWLEGNGICPPCRCEIEKEPGVALSVMGSAIIEDILQMTDPALLAVYIAARKYHSQNPPSTFRDMFSKDEIPESKAIWDGSDGIYRCSECTWEVVRRKCQKRDCGHVYPLMTWISPCGTLFGPRTG